MLFYVHSKQRRSCRGSKLSNHTVPGIFSPVTFQNVFIFTAAYIVPCGSSKMSPVHRNSIDYIFLSFWIIGFILSYFENRILLKLVPGGGGA